MNMNVGDVAQGQKVFIAIQKRSSGIVLGTFSSEKLAKKTLSKDKGIPEEKYYLLAQYLDNPYL